MSENTKTTENGKREESAKSPLSHARNQYISTITANLVILGFGAWVGFISPALEKFGSKDTPLLSGPLTNEEKSWLGSINCVGALPGAICFGYIITWLGAKRTVLFLCGPCLICWMLIYFGDMYYHIFIARFIGGWVSGGTHSTLVLFVSEIANDEIRGRLATMTLLARHLGILLGYILGACPIKYEHIPIVSASIFMIFLILFAWQPNTPRYHIRKGQFEQAEKSLRHYKGFKGKSELADLAILDEMERLKSVESEQKVQEKLRMSDFLNRSAMKGLLIGITLVAISHSTGHYLLTTYAVMIFKIADSSLLTPYMSSILLAVALIFGSLTTTTLVDILGRKFLIQMSLIGSAVGLFAMAIYDYLKISGFDLSSYTFVPILSLSLVVFISAAGIVPLSVLVSVENLPAKIRNMSVAIIIFASNATCFVYLKLFPPLLESIGLRGYMSICGILCIVGTYFVAIVLTETKGQSLDNIGVEKKTKNGHFHCC